MSERFTARDEVLYRVIDDIGGQVLKAGEILRAYQSECNSLKEEVERLTEERDNLRTIVRALGAALPEEG